MDESKGMKSLARTQAYARFAMVVLLSATIGANFWVADQTIAGRLAAPWPPLVWWISVELTVRHPGSGDWFARVRLAGVGVVGLVAAGMSFSHIAEFADAAGWPATRQWALPILIDGALLVISMMLIEVHREMTKVEAAIEAKRSRERKRTQNPAPKPKPEKVKTPVPQLPADAGLSVVGDPKPTPASVVRQMKDEGKTHEEIALALDISTKTVQRRLKEEGAA